MLFREASLLRLFSLLAANAAVLPQLPSTDSQGGSGNAYVAQAVDFIYTNYMHSICISDIAEKIGISRTYLNRLFKFEYNMSAQEFLMNFRMHKAAFSWYTLTNRSRWSPGMPAIRIRLYSPRLSKSTMI